MRALRDIVRLPAPPRVPRDLESFEHGREPSAAQVHAREDATIRPGAKGRA